MKTLFFAKASKGRPVFDAPAQVALHLNKLEGKDIQVSIEPRKRKRSLNQNSYMWGVVIEMLAEYFGYSPEEMHTALRFKFLNRLESGKPVTARSTTDLSTSEMEDYLSRIRIWAATEYSVNIPEPNEVDWSE